jgi:hypothetical protein
MNCFRLRLMHGIHIVKPCDCTLYACLSRQLHKTLDCLQVGLLVTACHICPFNTCLDCVGRACAVAG